MGYPKKVRLHYKDGQAKTETFGKFCIANNVDRAGGLALLYSWERRGIIKRRSDGGFDVIKFQPRQKPAARATQQDGKGTS